MIINHKGLVYNIEDDYEDKLKADNFRETILSATLNNESCLNKYYTTGEIKKYLNKCSIVYTITKGE